MPKTVLPGLLSLLFLVKTSSAKRFLHATTATFHDIAEQLPVPLHRLGISWMQPESQVIAVRILEILVEGRMGSGRQQKQEASSYPQCSCPPLSLREVELHFFSGYLVSTSLWEALALQFCLEEINSLIFFVASQWLTLLGPWTAHSC